MDRQAPALLVRGARRHDRSDLDHRPVAGVALVREHGHGGERRLQGEGASLLQEEARGCEEEHHGN